MKQTAVEWFMQQLPTIDKYDPYYQYLFTQAKAMEREQIMTAFTQGDIFGSDYFDGVNITEENYYNQTYKSK